MYTAGQTIEFSLMLWSASPLALEALAQPGAIEAGYYKSDVFALDALNPKNSSRKNRKLEQLAPGRVWLTDSGRPAEDAPAPECVLVTLPETSATPKSPTSPGGVGAGAGSSHRVKGAPSSRMQEVWVPDAEEEERADDATLTSEAASPKEGSEPRPPSPTPSFEGLDDILDPERVVRLDGEVRVPACSHPSFRYASMGREVRAHRLFLPLRLTATAVYPAHPHQAPAVLAHLAHRDGHRRGGAGVVRAESVRESHWGADGGSVGGGPRCAAGKGRRHPSRGECYPAALQHWACHDAEAAYVARTARRRFLILSLSL